jgi:transcriptional regulator with XRE-family HTH domain
MNIKSNISIKFGEKVRELRLAKGLSQEQLANLANVHRTYIGMVERAEKNITLVNIEKIAIAFNITLKDFFDYEK